jgi:hypothetical protein
MRPEAKKNLKFERNLTRYGMMAVAAAAAVPAQATLIVWDPADVTTPVNGWVYFSMSSGEVSTATPANWDFQLFHQATFSTSSYAPFSLNQLF